MKIQSQNEHTFPKTFQSLIDHSTLSCKVLGIAAALILPRFIPALKGFGASVLNRTCQSFIGGLAYSTLTAGGRTLKQSFSASSTGQVKWDLNDFVYGVLISSAQYTLINRSTNLTHTALSIGAHFLIGLWYPSEKVHYPVFDVDVIEKVAHRAKSLTADDFKKVDCIETLPCYEKAAARLIYEELEKHYPDRISEDRTWFPNYAGGATGHINLFFGSLQEYLILFCTPIGTEGPSGRYNHVAIYDSVTRGKIQADDLEQSDSLKIYEPDLNNPGPTSLLKPGKVKHFNTTDGTCMIEYAKGNIPSSLPFGILVINGIVLDGGSIADSFRIYGKQAIRNWFKEEF